MPTPGGPAAVDVYIAGFPQDVQAVLERVRATIRKAAPEAEEYIGYQMPAYRLHGALVYFGAWKGHYALYGASGALVEVFADQLSKYEVSKGTIKFPFDRPVPVRLITQLVKYRAEENRQRAAAKAAGKRAAKD